MEMLLNDESCECVKDTWSKKIATTPLNHLTLQEMVEHNFINGHQAKSYFKFCFIRNPWDRAVSEVAYMGPVFEGKTINEKIKSLSETKAYGNHVRPQTEFIDNDYGIKMDFIGRFETLDEDFSRLCRILKQPETLSLPHQNSSKHSNYQEYYDDHSKALIERKYKSDISRFGYSF